MTGFIYWGILVFILLIIGFIGWKYLTNITGYGNRKTEIGLGIGTIVLVFATFLFFPFALYNIGDVVREVGKSIQTEVVNKSHDLYAKNNRDNLKKVLDGMLENYSTDISIFVDISDVNNAEAVEKFEEQKEKALNSAIEAAITFKDNKGSPFFETLDTAMQLFKVNGVPMLKDVPEQYTVDAVQQLFAPYNEAAKKDIVENPTVSKLVSGIIEGTSFEGIMGVKDADLDVLGKSEKNIAMFLPKKIILFVSIPCFLILILIVVVLYCLRELSSETEDVLKKDHIFQFNNKIFDYLNEEKK
ncbi:MAG: hypothetical protein J6X78_00125 [Treponema sp.]|nr:hypothetical protein [Treponema sp.]